MHSATALRDHETLLRIAQRRHRDLATIQAQKAQQGRGYPTPGPASQVLSLQDAVRHAQGAAHPDKTWCCALCQERTRFAESTCWNCDAPRFPLVLVPAQEAAHV
jgi:hypothetical protein